MPFQKSKRRENFPDDSIASIVSYHFSLLVCLFLSVYTYVMLAILKKAVAIYRHRRQIARARRDIAEKKYISHEDLFKKFGL